MLLATRVIALFAGVFATIIVFIFLFDWFPANVPFSWILFIICFAISCAVSTLISVLDDFSFSILKGQIFGMFGSSGAEKTTLVKILMGQLSGDLGTAEINACIMGDHLSVADRCLDAQLCIAIHN